MGPPRGVEEVNSFHRMLVSVSALADQFCQVNFDSKGASAVTDTGGGQVSTEIGKRTSSGLFSFDIGALQKHQAQVSAVAA